KNGHTRVEHVIKVPFRNPAGEIDGVVLVAQDVTASYNTERALRRQATSLAGLVRRLSTREGEAESWFNEITREGCKTLGVSRCGIWMFTPGRMQLDPMSLFNAATETYVPGQSLRSKEFPRYFHALYQEGPLVIDNALVDPRASELFKAYLNPLGITSLLVAPIWVEGEMAGVVGLEHIGPPRHWSLEDQIYTVSLADAIAMVVSAFRRREAEARRQASESRFQALIEQSVQGMILHRNWDIVYANQAAADILGFDSVEDLLNRKDIGTLIAPEYMDRVRIHPAKPGAKSGWEYLSPAFKLNEIESLKKDGERVWTSNISQLLDWEGRTTVLTIFSDISEQKRIQAQLESSEQRFRFLIEKSVQGILLHRKRSLIFVNSSAATILGYDSAEELLSQRDLESIIDPADREKVRKLALARERGEAVPPYYEIRALKKNGELVWVSILGQVMEWEGAPAIFVIFNDISVQKHIQEQLRSSEQRFRHLTEHSLQGVFVHNNAIVEFANQAAADLLGFESLELLIGRNPILLLLPQDQQIMQERAQLRMAGEPVPNEYDIRMLRQDGMVIWVHMRNQLVDWDGKKSIVTVFNDISEQKHVQELLSSSEKRFRSLTEHSIQGVLVHQDGRVVLGNKTAANLLGFETPEDLVSKNSTDFFLPEDHSAIEERRRKRLAGEPVANQYDIRMVKKDGTAFWVHSLNHLVDWDGTPAIVMLFNDISEQKRIQTELLASQHRYRTLFEGSIQGVLVHNGLKPLYVNPAGARIFGFVSPEEVMALSSLSHMVNAEDLKWAWDEWQRQKMLGKQINFIHTVRGLRSRGGEVQVEAFSTEVVWEGRVAMQVTFVDVTEKLRLEEQLRQAQKMEAVGQLAGGVAHDINNTLQVLQMTLEMVTQYKSLPESMGKYVTGGLRAIQNSSNLVRQLLTFGRRHTLDMKDLDLNAAVRNHSEMFSRLLGSRIELNVKMPPETILVHADDGMLGQMLLNLMVNARDAMPNGGSITLSTASFIPDDSFLVEHPTALRKPYGRISVTDTGTGMSEEVRARIFEPFFTTKPIGRGTGLGLAMVYGLVKSHTGFISVSSTVGHGTTFHIFFPVVTPQGSPTTPVPVPAPSTPSPAGRGTLLVAEDQADLRAFIIDLLESEGYQVLPAANGEEALVLLRDNLDTIKLALLDMVMPRLGGLEVCREIRSRCPGIPVIFLTGHIPDDMSQALEDEIRAPILKKPISADDLVAIIS
ncbi:MAG: PAS domain S-box protein, partial [Deltaproteobacteria bacterium]|nr:PAS domain S-box protein [Deltaproteobacteria bacterium]